MMALSGVRISWLTLARKSVFCALARSAARARRDQFLLGVLPLRDVAQHGAEFAAVAEPADGHEQRDEAALRHPADHLAAIVEHAGDAVLGKPVEIVERRLAGSRSAKSAVNGSPATSRRRSRTAPRRGRLMIAMRPSLVDDDDAVGGGVEDGGEFVDPPFGRDQVLDEVVVTAPVPTPAAPRA